MTTRNRVIRQRLWSGDSADSERVGENFRTVESAILSAPPTREVEFLNRVYQTDGLSFSSRSKPRGAVVVYVEAQDGTQPAPSAVPQLSFVSGTATVKISGLTPGASYAAIRLLVVG